MKKLYFILLLLTWGSLAVLNAQLEVVAENLGQVYRAAIDGNELYFSFGVGGLSGIDKVELNQTPITIEGVLNTNEGIRTMQIVGSDLYYLNASAGSLQKLDLANLGADPQTIISGLSNPFALIIDGDVCYITDQGITSGLYSLDLTATEPELSLVTSISGSLTFLEKRNDILYLSRFGQGDILAIDIGQSPVSVSVLVSNFFQPVGLAINGDFLYFTTSTSVRRLDLNDPDLNVETVVNSGLSGTRGVAFDGVNLYITQQGDGGKIFRLPISNPVFSTQPNVCLNTTPNNLGGASPTGGIYAGPGVTDNGDGATYTFDPVAAGGIGAYDITYTLNDVTANAEITVVEAPTVTFDLGDLSYDIDAGIQTGLDGGTPTGGVYSGAGVTDDGNGMTFIFDPMAAGAGDIEITYTFADDNGCGGPATSSIMVNTNLPGDDCISSIAIDSLFGAAVGEPQNSRLYDNTDYAGTSPTMLGYDCFFDSNNPLQGTIWYTFTGDGETYDIRTNTSGSTNGIPAGDTQLALYVGNCGALTPVTCNEDEGSNLLNSKLTLNTETGIIYYIFVDGTVSTFGNGRGQYRVEVTRNTDVAVTDLQELGTTLYPNPTNGLLFFQGEIPVRVELLDVTGRKVLVNETATNSLDIGELPAGLYTLVAQMRDGQLGASKVLKN